MDQAFSDQLVELLPRLRRFARGLTGSREEGDDVVQAACERALARRDQFEPGSRLDSWMYRIMQTVWIDQLRKRRRGEIGLDGAELAQFADNAGVLDPEERLYLAEVRRAIKRLADEHRQVLLLVCVEGFSYRRAAEILDLPLGTVMSRLSRARLALGRDLQKDQRQVPMSVSAKVVRLKR